jgi:hypothetical protein
LGGELSRKGDMGVLMGLAGVERRAVSRLAMNEIWQQARKNAWELLARTKKERLELERRHDA